MAENKRPKERLLALAVLGGLALNYPLLSLFNREELVLGIPVLFLYLFGFWVLFLLLIALIVPRKSVERG
ncbi:MAG: hypothetical protein H7835_17775 [Magnetococcus sp. XQGC-1]